MTAPSMAMPVAQATATARPVALAVLAAAAVVAAVASAWGLWHADSVAAAVLALSLHVGATLAARAAAAAGGGSGADLDLVAVLAAAMPGCGPAFAWWLPVGRDVRAVHNAHAAYEEAEARLTPRAKGPLLERELGVVSHAQVLQHGSLEEKRNLLRRIARLGDVRYLTLLRQFLRDPEPELRLCAYAELARAGQQREEAIAGLRTRVEALATASAATRAAAIAELAEANRGYGTSGLLDADMAEYWLRQAQQIAERALAEDATNVAAQRVLVLVRAEFGDVAGAWSIAAGWPEDAATPVLMAKAEVAFRRRDRAACRRAAEVLRARGEALPPWLEAVLGVVATAPAHGAVQPSARPAADRDRIEAAQWMPREAEIVAQAAAEDA